MEIEKQVCFVDQMEELKKLGFDITKASMTWIKYFKDDEWTLIMHHNEEELRATSKIPAFSIADMLEMLPYKLVIDNVTYFLSIEKIYCSWFIQYEYNANVVEYLVDSKSLRDALVAELKLLKENKEI